MEGGREVVKQGVGPRLAGAFYHKAHLQRQPATLGDEKQLPATVNDPSTSSCMESFYDFYFHMDFLDHGWIDLLDDLSIWTFSTVAKHLVVKRRGVLSLKHKTK